MASPDFHLKTAAHRVLLSFGQPDPQTLPVADLRAAMLRVMDSSRVDVALQYGAEQGNAGLIDVLVEKIRREQELTIGPENVMITAGSTHSVDMLTRLLTRPGSVLFLESPTYVDSLHLFRDQQLDLHPLPMDEEGLLPAALAQEIERLGRHGLTPRLLYTIPTFHNPTGRTSSEARRREIIELAHRHDFWILEDDVYRDLAYDTAAPRSFYALANGKQVLSTGSFSKTLAPGLRLGWFLGPAEIVQQCVNFGLTCMSGGANPLMAQTVAEYCLSGAWEPHIQRQRELYRARRDSALEALARLMPPDVSWTRPAGGFFLWLHLPAYALARQVRDLALQQGVVLTAGDGFFVEPADGEHSLRIAFSYASSAELAEGISVLARILRALHP